MNRKVATILPDWVVLHVPHDSTFVPKTVLGQFLLNEEGLEAEIEKITDHHTYDLFCGGQLEKNVVAAAVSRLVVDVERFVSDEHEPMAARGMGAVYEATTDLSPLRRALSAEERAALLDKFYHPHHKKLEEAVAGRVGDCGRCLVLDCHSFPDKPLPYELAPSDASRPDICIGTDSFHTSRARKDAFVRAFQDEGFSVSIDAPFSGAMVPMSRYKTDLRVEAIMVEVNRRLYLEGTSSSRRSDFGEVAARVRAACVKGALAA